MSIDAMKQALEALEHEAQKGNDDAYRVERDALRAAIEQTEKRHYDADHIVLEKGTNDCVCTHCGQRHHMQMPISMSRMTATINAFLEAHHQCAAPRQWQGLTDEEINNSYLFWVVDQQDVIGFGKSIETKLKRKNT